MIGYCELHIDRVMNEEAAALVMLWIQGLATFSEGIGIGWCFCFFFFQAEDGIRVIHS